jgi:hypothetical protein
VNSLDEIERLTAEYLARQTQAHLEAMWRMRDAQIEAGPLELPEDPES